MYRIWIHACATRTVILGFLVVAAPLAAHSQEPAAPPPREGHAASQAPPAEQDEGDGLDDEHAAMTGRSASRGPARGPARHGCRT